MKAIKFIKQRDELSIEIAKYWDIISKQNVMPRALKRTHDLKALYNEILLMGARRAMAKWKLTAINMGYKSFKDVPTDHQHVIYKLGELQEVKVKLERLQTINPVLKAKKGKKGLNKTEELTFNWVKARIKEIDLQIITLKDKISKFNEDTEFDDSEVPASLAA